MLDNVNQPIKDWYANMSIEERARYFQRPVADATARSAFVMKDEQPMSKVASYMASSSAEQLLNETAQLNAKLLLRYQPSLPSTTINATTPLIDFKEKSNDGANTVGSAALLPQTHRQPATIGQTEVHLGRVEMPAALPGGVIGMRESLAESCNQVGSRDIHQDQPLLYRRASNWGPLPEPMTLASDPPSCTDLAREMQAKRSAFLSSQEKTDKLRYQYLTQQASNRSDLPLTSDLDPDMQAHREAFRSTQEKKKGLFYHDLLQQKDKFDAESKPSSYHSSKLAAKEPVRQPLPQTPILRHAEEQSRVASATLPDHEPQTWAADGESQLGQIPPSLSSASNVQLPSKAALLDYQTQLYQLQYRNQLRKLEFQATLHGVGRAYQGSETSSSILSNDELKMIHPFMRKLATGKSSAEPQNPQEELAMPQIGPQKVAVTEDKRELQDAMFRDLHKQDSQARSAGTSSPLLSTPGEIQDTYGAWIEAEVAKTSPVDSHFSQKKAPVDGSYLAEEERKVLDHVRDYMSTNLPVNKVQDRSSTIADGSLEPARCSVIANAFVEDLHTLSDYPNLREHMTSRVGCVRPIGSPLDGNLPQGPIPEAKIPSMLQVHKATQTFPGRKTDSLKELDAILQARSWNITNTEASRRAEEIAKASHDNFFGGPSKTRNCTSTVKISKPSAAVDTLASCIPVRESTVMPPLYECLPCRPKAEKADVSLSRPTPSAPATRDRSVVGKMQTSGVQTAPCVSNGQHPKVVNHDTQSTNNQLKPAKETPNELLMAPNSGDQNCQVTSKSSELLGMLQDIGNGIRLQAPSDTLTTEDLAEPTVKPVVSNKLQLSEEKREQMIKEGPRSLRDFQRAVGCIDSGKISQPPSHPPSLTRDTNVKPVDKEPAAPRLLRFAKEQENHYDKRRLRELMHTLCLDAESQSQKRGGPEYRSGRLEPEANHYWPDGSNPNTIKKPRAAKADTYPPEKDNALSEPRYTLESEGQVMWNRDYVSEETLRESSLRHTNYTSAKINPTSTDCPSSATKTQFWVEPSAVGRVKLMSEFWSQPECRIHGCDPKPRSGDSPKATRDASCYLQSPPMTSEADLRSDVGGLDIDNWRMLVDSASKGSSAVALAAAKRKLVFRTRPILGSAPAKNKDSVATNLPMSTRGVAYKPPAVEKGTTPSAATQANFSSRNGIRVSITGDTEARSADTSTDVFIAGDKDEDNGKGDQNDWTVLGSDYSSSRHSLIDLNEVLEAAPSEASDPSSMDVEVGDDLSEGNEEEWIIC